MGHDCSLVGKMVRTKIGDVSEILSSDEIGIKEKEELMQIFKDIAYQWCSSAAAFVALDAAVFHGHGRPYGRLFLYNETVYCII